MNTIAQETALRLERLENIVGQWEDHYESRKDTTEFDAGRVEAYAHCRAMIHRFVEALASSEADLADTLLDMEHETNTKAASCS